jgi:tetratricopeptide (TPR) repeat protein
MDMRDKHRAILEEAYEKHPRNSRIVIDLAYQYLFLQEPSNAEKILIKALDENVFDERVEKNEYYFALGRAYLLQKKHAEAEALYAEAVKEFPEDQRLAASFALYCLDHGDPEKAEIYFNKAEKMSLSQVREVTQHNYKRLKEILQNHGIQLVAVQYPLRSVHVLKRMLDPYDDIIFVDNEKVFKEAVKNYRYDALFWDRFAGDFGHCTDQGNRILAENIAQTIIKEYFKK